MKLHGFQLVSHNLFQKMLTERYFLQIYLQETIILRAVENCQHIKAEVISYSDVKMIFVTDFMDAKISFTYLFFYQIKGVKASSDLKNSYLKSISTRHTCNMKLSYHIYQNSSLMTIPYESQRLQQKQTKTERTAPLLALLNSFLRLCS